MESLIFLMQPCVTSLLRFLISAFLLTVTILHISKSETVFAMPDNFSVNADAYSVFLRSNLFDSYFFL